MAELLVEYFSTPVAFVYFDQLLNVSQRVWLAVSVCAAVRAALACKLASACKGQESISSAEALYNVGMQMGLHPVIHIAPELLLRLSPAVLNALASHLRVTLDAHTKDVAAGLHEFLQCSLLVCKVPAALKHMAQREGAVLSLVILRNLVSMHLALTLRLVPAALPCDLPHALRLVHIALADDRLALLVELARRCVYLGRRCVVEWRGVTLLRLVARGVRCE